MPQKAFVLTGLGYGDEGKGTTTDWLCRQTDAHTDVRTGGPQAFHNVVTSDGREHSFSQFGSGTLGGVKTHLSPEMMVDPYAVLNEGRALIELGEEDAFDRMTIDRDALLIAPFQAIANRLRETIRGDWRYSSVGIGVGETMADSEQYPELAIRARDIGRACLKEKLEGLRQLKLRQMHRLVEPLKEVSDKIKEQVEFLQNPEVVDWAVEEFNYMAELVRIVDASYLREILSQPGVVIFEPSQGVLLDRWYGFHPYTTMVNPKQDAAMKLLAESGFDGEIVRLGLMRGYQTRHGNGPFVTEDASLGEKLSDIHNRKHQWQGDFRVGYFDAVATRYAIGACGGPKAFDGLVISCLDRVAEIPPRVCDSYTIAEEKDNPHNFFRIENEDVTGIVVRPNTRDVSQLCHQARLGQLLRCVRPNYTEGNAGQSILDMIRERFPIPIALTSWGPTEKDKRAEIPF